MGITLTIAKKEFTDLIRDPCIVFVILAYLVIILGSVSDINYELSKGVLNSDIDFFYRISNEIIHILTSYGSIVALMIGFSSISHEQLSNSLNTLITKPLYRDNIINGKLIGCISFLICIFGLAIAFYISSLLVICGNPATNLLLMFLKRLPIILVISLIYVMIFLAFSMLISILIKSQGVALVVAILSFITIDKIIQNVIFVGYISLLFGENQLLICNIVNDINPQGILSTIMTNVFYYSNFNDYLYDTIFNFIKLLIYLSIILVATYSTFLKRDIL